MTNIQIHKANGTLLYSAPITKDAIFRHELMTEEYVQLVFNEVSQVDFPIGCYLEHEGRKYVVTTLVYPELIDGGYKYSIRFEAEWMRWRNITCFFVNEFTGKPEANWSMTATPDLFLQQITRNISRAIGQIYTFAYDSSLTATKDLTFDNKTVLEALSMIAEAFETEWWVEGSVIHLSRCEHGEAVVLTQGVNIGAPTSSGESEYATRIYAYGSTRNITQDYQSGGTTNALVEKRLTLPVDRYPNGYRDIKAGLSAEEIIEKTVIFDDIYPSSDFPISSVRMDLRLDTDTVVGTNEDGTPIYDTCPVYYFKIEGIDFSDELIIEGQTLKVHFLSGHLQGREFELAYHSTSQEYEIVTDKENGAVKLPNETLMPQDGDTVILFNIQMPDEYVTSAENRLAEALEAYVNEKILSDTYTYSFASNPVAFANDSIALTVGQKVTLNYVFGTLDTRVLSVEFPLYAPSKMEISVGESTPKGKLETIETETVNASSQIEIIQAYNNAAKTIQNQLNRATQIMAEGLAKLGNMWYIDKSQDTTADKSDSSKWIVRTSYPVSTDQWIAQFGIYTGGEGGTSGSGTMYHDQLQHLDWPNQHPIEAITGLQDALNGKLATTAISAWALQPEKPSYTWAEISGKPSAFTPAAHTHGMSEINGLSAALAEKLGVDHASDTTLHLTAGQRAVLSMLSVDTDGNLKIDGNAFTTGWLAQLGAATDEGGTGGGGTLYHDELEHLDYPDQHPITAIVGLQSALNGKASTALVTTSTSGLMSATDKAKLDGIAAGANNYVLPIASASVLGGIRVGSRLSIASGVLSANAQAWSEITGKPTTFTPAAHTQGWDTITGKPTTLSGYGITDAMTASAISNGFFKADGSSGLISDLTVWVNRKSGMYNVVDPNAYKGLIKFKGAWSASGLELLFDYSLTQFQARTTIDGSKYGDWRTIWHSGNFNPDSKLSLSGGTMSGQLIVQSSGLKMLGNTGANGQTASFFVDQYGFGVNCQNSAGNTVGQIRIHTQLNSPTFWNGDGFKKMWHEGNDGANSGLDADLLDGRHASEFWGHFQTTIDASSLSEDYYYPVTILVSPYCRMRISVIVSLNSGTKPSWSSHGQGFSCRFIEEITGEGWGTIRSNRLILDSTFQFADKNPIGEVWQMTNSNNEVIYVRGGGKYFFYTTEATTITLRTTSFTSGGQTAAPKLVSSLTPAPYKSGAGLIGLSTLYCNSIVIGGHIITWDSAKNALKIDGNVYTTGTINQLG